MKYILIVALSLMVLFNPAQNRGVGPEETSIKKELRLKKQLRKERKERRRLERAERKKVKKHHRRIQTKQVQKRMKKSKSTAVRNNNNQREFFLKRWFSKKSRPKGRPAKKD